MYSTRCRERIEEELARLGITMSDIDQGLIEIQEELTEGQVFLMKEILLELGYEILDGANSKLLDSISEEIDKLILENPEVSSRNYPSYLTKKLKFNYSDIAELFLKVYGISLPQYVTIRQVERIKEMLLYEDRTIQEIAAIFHYKDGDQLARTVKKVTGLTPSYYKQLKKRRSEFRDKMNSNGTGTSADANRC